jgi:hypothetical protein
MVEKIKYILEIETTFAFAADHLLLWRLEGGVRPVDTVCDWIDRIVVPILSQ